MGDSGGAGTGPGGDGGTGPGRFWRAVGTVMERIGDFAILAWVEIPNTRAATLAAWATRDSDGGWTIRSGTTREICGGISPERDGPASRLAALRATEVRLYAIAHETPDALPLTHGPG